MPSNGSTVKRNVGRSAASDLALRIDYQIAGEAGDLPAASQMLALPFKLTPSDVHPFLTLENYFVAIEKFLLRNHGATLLSALQARLGSAISLDTIHRLSIRSEKHGTLYHIASVDVFTSDERVKLTVSSAVSKTAKECLRREFQIIQTLSRSHNLPYLPIVYGQGDVHSPSGHGYGPQETFAMVLSDWFEGFHEWHTTIDQKNGRRRIVVWDHGTTARYLSEEAWCTLLKEASKILTLYYHPATFRQIYPWHHAAGDFVVNAQDKAIDVRLVTVREYQSIMDAFSTGPIDPLIAIVYFFLNLTVRMRLDRLDGVKDVVWIGDTAVSATVEGFFEAIGHMVRQGKFTLCTVEALVSLLRAFAPEELKGLYQSLSVLYEEGDPEEYALIRTQLDRHVSAVWTALRAFH